MKTIRIASLLVVYLSISFSSSILGQNNTQSESVEKHMVHSAILKEDREYLIQLPQSYYSTTIYPKQYPVLLLLDGDVDFEWATGVIRFMSMRGGTNGNIPEIIVLGIPNKDRIRDLTPTQAMEGPDGKQASFAKTSGGGDNFLQFIEKELLTEIERKYRTMPYRILVGHSLAGLLTVHASLTKPDVFNACIAIDPSLWWDKQVMTTKIKQLMNSKRKPTNRLYLSSGHNTAHSTDTTIFRRSIDRFYGTLKDNSPSTAASRLAYFEQEDHGSVPLLSLYHGLLFIFEGYTMKVFAKQPEAEDFEHHYQHISHQLGVKLLPSESTINGLGYYYLYEKKEYAKALNFFTLNTVNYPLSSNVYDSLAEAYKVIGNREKAIYFYKKTLELNPENESARKNLEDLSK
jgi:hypothetical protein